VRRWNNCLFDWYTVVGCADLDPPPNARVDRYDDSVVVRCNLSHETWYLTCKGSAWIGTITNCSEGSASIQVGISYSFWLTLNRK